MLSYISLYIFGWGGLKKLLDNTSFFRTNEKREKIMANFISMAHALICNITFLSWLLGIKKEETFSVSISYFLYDLYYQVKFKDKLMILHHIISIYTLYNAQKEHPDHEKVRWGLHFLEFSNIPVHPAYLFYSTQIKNKSLKVILEYVLIHLEFVFFGLFRCIFPSFLFPFKDPVLYVLALLTQLGGIVWTYNLYKQMKQIRNM